MKRLELNNKGKILGVGEIMLRLTPTNMSKVIQASSFDATYSGAEANVMCSLSMFGHDTKIVTKLPNNELGNKVTRDMKAFGVDTSDVVYGDGRLGIYFLEQGHGLRSSEVIYDRKYSAISMVNENEFNIDKILSDVKLLHISGITPALGRELYNLTISLAKEAKKRGITVCFDSNYRAKLWSLEEARELLEEILQYVDIAFLGILDLKNILKYTSDDNMEFKEELAALYTKMISKYPNIKYVSSTKRTVNSINNNSLQGFLFDGQTLHTSNIHTFDILDRVGGGDSFTAGILHGILSNMSDEETVEFGTCASVLKHSIRGDINLVKESDVMSLMKSGIENIKR